MFVILCNNFNDACDAFDIFCNYLDQVHPWEIRTADEYSNVIDTESGVRYIFIDYRYEKIFKKYDIINVEDFFDGV